MGDQTTQVESSVAILGSLKSLLDHLVAGELILLDGLVDADNILPDDTAGTNVQVTDFRVAHQALGQADSEGGCLELSVAGGALGEGIHDGGLGVGDGIAVLGGLGGGDTPAINDDCKCE